MALTDRIEELISPTIEDMGFSVVRVQYSGKDRPRLQIMAERLDGEIMVVDDCADISRAVSAVLDVEDPITDAYTLEVSSPGLDRPLVKLRDFERFAGFDIRAETAGLIGGRRRFRGRLNGIVDDQVQMTIDGVDVSLPFAEIVRAKLLMTDELLGSSEGRQEL